MIEVRHTDRVVGSGKRRMLAMGALAGLLAGAAPREGWGATACFVNTNPPSSGTSVTGSVAVGPGCPTPSGTHNVGYAGTFNISIDGGPSTLAYCVDLLNPISPGQCEPQQDVPDLPCEAVWILNHYYPHTGGVGTALSPTSKEAAAVQAALWHFTDCYDISGPADIEARADAIIADAIANGAACDPPTAPHTVTIAPSIAINVLPTQSVHTAVATVLDTQGDPVPNTAITIQITGVSGPQTITGTTDANGQFGFFYSNSFLNAGSDNIKATVSFTVPVGLAFKAPGIQGIVLAGSERIGKVEGNAVKNWVEPRCGDGIVNQAAEQCDDGNAVDGDGCDANCTTTGCGNGVVTAPEQCDDGNAINGDGCDANCTLPRCGNGAIVPPEECDDGNLIDGDGCDGNCRVTGCGNGVVTPPEQCDDGNTVQGDGCDNNCTTTACGNGVTTAPEQCDDGNQVNGDGCDTNCTTTACGNGITSPPEQCDDGNVVNGDGCDANCTTTACGNGITTAPEQCDDGNQVNGDGCDVNCTFPGCGNGITTPPEQCDDGNQADGDGCDGNCTTTACGNGVQTPPEQCDDGNVVNGDGCDANCTPSGCGNGIPTPPEQCDDGNQVNGDACDTNCTTPACGNGITTPPEQCDDGNTIDGDSCEGDCSLPVCGNGIVDVLLGEQCDDGNTADGDGCSATCQLQEICTNLTDDDGDGLIDCDDPDCDCQVFGKDPASIVFRPTRPGHDKFKVHGRMTLQNPNGFLSGRFGILLTNSNGVIYRSFLEDGDLGRLSKGASFRDPTATKGPGARGGIYKVRIKNKGAFITIAIQVFADLDRATIPVMGVQVLSGGEVAYYKSEWKKTPSGWVLTLPRVH